MAPTHWPSKWRVPLSFSTKMHPVCTVLLKPDSAPTRCWNYHKSSQQRQGQPDLTSSMQGNTAEFGRSLERRRLACTSPAPWQADGGCQLPGYAATLSHTCFHGCLCLEGVLPKEEEDLFLVPWMSCSLHCDSLFPAKLPWQLRLHDLSSSHCEWIWYVYFARNVL